MTTGVEHKMRLTDADLALFPREPQTGDQGPQLALHFTKQLFDNFLNFQEVYHGTGCPSKGRSGSFPDLNEKHVILHRCNGILFAVSNKEALRGAVFVLVN